jgi:phage-related protein
VLAGYARVVELLVEFGPDVRMPHSRSLGEGLFELRIRGRDQAARVMYCHLAGRRVIMLHAFLKKSRKAPLGNLRLARRRMREVGDGR